MARPAWAHSCTSCLADPTACISGFSRHPPTAKILVFGKEAAVGWKKGSIAGQGRSSSLMIKAQACAVQDSVWHVQRVACLYLGPSPFLGHWSSRDSWDAAEQPIVTVLQMDQKSLW